MKPSSPCLFALLFLACGLHAAPAFPGAGERMKAIFEDSTFDLDFHRDGSTLTFRGTAGTGVGVQDTVTYRHREIARGIHQLTWQRIDPATGKAFTSVVHTQNWNTRRVYSSFSNERMEFTHREGPLVLDPYH